MDAHHSTAQLITGNGVKFVKQSVHPIPFITDDNLKPAERSGTSAVICHNLRLQQGKRNGDPYGAVSGQLLPADEASALTLFMYVNDSVELNSQGDQ